MNRVGIFWDYENCAPPTGTPGYVVAERLRTTCGAHGSVMQFRAYLELSAAQPSGPLQPSHSATADLSPNDPPCPSTSLKTLTLRSELQSSGVSLIDCPHNSRKNVADSMLACDLVCFALDNPAVPQIPYPNYIPASPYSVPGTPFSAVAPPTIPFSKTTIVLISGDRDFAYPLAVLKARKYDVGLIVPPGGAHPSLRAQASWVMNWKDVLEGTNVGQDARCESAIGTGNSTRGEGAGADGQSGGPGVGHGGRRSSFVSRRGSVSNSRRGSVSAPPDPAPPPPPIALEPTPKASTSARQSSPTPDPRGGTSTTTQRPPMPTITLPPPADSSPSAQPPTSSKASRKPSVRRAAKTGSRPPSRAKSRVTPKPNRAERAEQEASKTSKPELSRPQPTIVPVPLTVSPVGAAGPSFTGMSPRTGRPHTPPLFSTNPTTPSPPAAPPALPPPTPPTKNLTPPVKPPTPPREALRPPHRATIPHVATPRPPISGPQPALGNQAPQGPPRVSSPTSPPTVPAPVAGVSVLQSLIPAASALRPATNAAPVRPVLAVPTNIQITNPSALTPATPATPPESPPFRSWNRLQPVHDDTDGDSMGVEKKLKKGKEKIKDKTEPTKNDAEERPTEEGAAQQMLNSKKSMKLAVQVGLLLKVGEEPSAISGVDSILKSYVERTPSAEWDGRGDDFAQGDQGAPVPGVKPKDENERVSAPDRGEEDEEEEEKFHETFFATFSRSQPVQANAPRTPSTVKGLELTLGDNVEMVPVGGEPQRSRFSTPRPVPARSSHSLPTLLPMMQSLLAGVEGTRSDLGDNVLGVRTDPQSTMGHNIDCGSDHGSERLYSRANSPPMPPSFPRRTNSLTAPIESGNFPKSPDLALSPTIEATYREFHFLINVLERWRRNGHDCPLRSLIGIEFSPEVFAQIGVTSFKDYVQRAVAAGVVVVGGGCIQGREWISLNREWQGLGLVLE